jgi:hypothetical protein
VGAQDESCYHSLTGQTGQHPLNNCDVSDHVSISEEL